MSSDPGPLLAPLSAGLALGLALLLAGMFHRGRAALAALVLLWAWGVLAARFGMPFLPEGARVWLTFVRLEAVLVLVPLELAVLAMLRETVLVSRTGAVTVAVLLAQALAGRYAPAELWDGLWALERWPARLLSTFFSDRGVTAPGASSVVALLGCGIALVRGWRGADAVLTGLAGAVLAMGVLGWGVLRGLSPWLPLGFAGLSLLAGVGWTSYRLAFLDALTGLPGRRMLDERLGRLGRHWAVAMVDVDHFKKFNDTHGHDVGDQVLKLVAATLRRHFGRDAFRYGGEEFSVVFDGRRRADAEARCDAFREDIAGRSLVLRGADRPASAPKGAGGKRSRGSGKQRPEGAVGVTVSIGIASRTDAMRRPEVVLKAADVALYASKKSGRNRVSVHA